MTPKGCNEEGAISYKALRQSGVVRPFGVLLVGYGRAMRSDGRYEAKGWIDGKRQVRCRQKCRQMQR